MNRFKFLPQANAEMRFAEPLVILVFVSILCTALVAVVVDKQLSADGVYVFVGVLEWKGFLYFDWHRQFGLNIAQFPLVVATNLGIRDIPTLRVIFGAGLLIPWLLAFAISWIALRNEDRSILLFFLLSLMSINLASDYILAGEHQIMVVLGWPILFYLLRQSHFSWYDVACLIGLLICFTRLYPTAFAPAIIFTLVALQRLVSTSSRYEKAIFLSVVILSMLVIGISAYSIVFPRDIGNRSNFAPAMIRALTTPENVMNIVFLVPFFMGWYLHRIKLTWLAFIPIVAYVIYVFVTGHIISAVESFENRSLSIFLLPLLMLGAILIKAKSRRLEIGMVLPILVFTTVVISSNLYSTNQWNDFRTQFKNELSLNHGLIPAEATDLLVHAAAWPWNVSLLSIVWSEGCVQTVIQEANDLDWGPAEPPEFFWLTQYSCYSREYLQFNDDLCVCD